MQGSQREKFMYGYGNPIVLLEEGTNQKKTSCAIIMIVVRVAEKIKLSIDAFKESAPLSPEKDITLNLS